MSKDEVINVLLSVALALAGGVCTLVVYIIRVAARWSRVEQRLEDLIRDVSKLVQDKDTVHRDLVSAMREDRKATDQRLQWLERNLWKKQLET